VIEARTAARYAEVRHNIVCLHDGALIHARDMDARRPLLGDELVLANALAGG
jgi:hypothetical protein